MKVLRLSIGVAAIAGAMFTGVGTEVTHADTYEPHQWCPGNPKNWPYAPNSSIDWDWNTCHTWYPVQYGWGNATMNGQPTSIWIGDDPPIEAITKRQCPPIAFMCP